MAPRKSNANQYLVDVDSLPCINIDLKAKEVLAFMEIQHSDICEAENHFTFCRKHQNSSSDAIVNDKLLGKWIMILNNTSFFKRNVFLSSEKKDFLSKIFNDVKNIKEKARNDSLSQEEIKKKLISLTNQTIQCIQEVPNSEILKVIDFIRSQITKVVHNMNTIVMDSSSDTKKFEEQLRLFQRHKKTLAAQISLLKTASLPRNINCIFRKLYYLKDMYLEMCQEVPKNKEGEAKEGSKWFDQLVILFIDYKAILMVVQLLDTKLDSEGKAVEPKKRGRKPKAVVEEEKKTVGRPRGRPRGRPPKKKVEVIEEETESSEAEEEEEEEEEIEEEEEEEEETKESETNDEKETETDEEKKEKEREKRIKENEMYKLSLPLLQLDCQSESPILAAFWLSKLAELQSPGKNMINETLILVISKMREFFNDIDVIYPMAKLFSDLRDLEEVLDEARLKEEGDNDILASIFEFFKAVKRLRHPLKLSSLYACIEAGRVFLSKKDNDCKNELIANTLEVSEEIFNTLVPISQMLSTMEALNRKAKEINASVDPLTFDFPYLKGFSITPYSNDQIQITDINKDFADYIMRYCEKLEDSGIHIIKQSASLSQLIIPSIYDILKEISALIEISLPMDSPLIEYAKEIKERVIDGNELLNIIKKFKKLEISMQSTGEGDVDQINQAINLLRKLNKLHTLLYILELGGLVSYSNTLQIIYLKVYSEAILGIDPLKDQLLLAPISTQCLVEIQRNIQEKLQSNILQQKISLLNRMKMSLGDIVSAAFTKEDNKDFQIYSKWIGIIVRLINTFDIDSIERIKPLCHSLPELPGFPQIAKGLEKLLAANSLTTLEARAVNHVRSICEAVFSVDITDTVTNINNFRIIAMTKDYTKLIKKVVDFGLVTVDEDYELGQYGDSYMNRFMEHHWHTKIIPLDDLFSDLLFSLPPKTEETAPLYSLLQRMKNGGMSMEAVIAFGNQALNFRNSFDNKEEFTLLYRKLYTFMSFLMHHDTLSKMIEKKTDRMIITFSLTRTFNYMRFVKYITTLIMRLNSCSVFSSQASRAICLQTIALQSMCSIIEPTSKLPDEACESLLHLLSLIESAFAQNEVSYDTLLAKIQLGFRILSTSSDADISLIANIRQTIEGLDELVHSDSSQELVTVSENLIEELNTAEGESLEILSCINCIKTALSSILELTRLKCVIQPATLFIEDNLNEIIYSDQMSFDSSDTNSSFITSSTHNITVPRPKITVPTSQLSLEAHNMIADMYLEMKEERKKLADEMAEIHAIMNESEELQRQINASNITIQKDIKVFNGLKDSISSMQDDSSQIRNANDDLQKIEYTEKMAQGYANSAALLSLRNKLISSENQMKKEAIAVKTKELNKRSHLLDNIKFNEMQSVSPFESMTQHVEESKNSQEKNLDPQLLEILNSLNAKF